MIPQKYTLKLRTELAGPLLESSDPGYDQSLVIDNGRIDFRPRTQAHSSTRKEGKNHG
jgi:hypothetical protein